MQMKLTTNFDSTEFDCKDGTPVPDKYLDNIQELAENLQVIRDYVGVKLRISGSGYRTEEHNTAVGGAKKSQHLTARAADINATGYTPKKLYAVILKLINEGKISQGGLGLYRTFVHYDIRGTKARW